jgi:hypothetical protein
MLSPHRGVYGERAKKAILLSYLIQQRHTGLGHDMDVCYCP